MDALALIRAQLRLECIGFDERGFLTRVAGTDPDEIARLYAYRHPGGFSIFFRGDVSMAIREEVLKLGPEGPYFDHGTVSALLEADQPSVEVRLWETYILTRAVALTEFPDVVRLADKGHLSRALYAIVKDGDIISSCKSVRENDQVGECFAFTEHKHRRLGYGRQVTAAWAQALHSQGKTAFYSHATSNEASERLAKSLALEHQFSLVTYG